MAEEQLRRNLEIAFDAGPDFPNRLLLSRTMAALKTRNGANQGRSKNRLQMSPRAMTLLAAVVVVALAIVSVGAFLAVNQFARSYVPGHHAQLMPATGVALGNLSAFSADDAAVWGLASSMRPQDPLYANTTLFITHDGGKNWLPVTLDNSQNAPSDVVWTDPDHIVVNEGAIYSTTDGGFHWQTSSLQLPAQFNDPMTIAQEIRVIDGHRAFAATRDGQLLVTSDSGQTWVTAKFVQISGLCTDGCDSQGPFMFGARGIFAVSSSSDLSTFFAYTTSDGGLTWSAPRREPGRSLDPVSADEWWVVDRFGQVSRSIDAGSTWTRQAVTGDVAGVPLTRVMPVVGSVMWAVAGEILLRSTDAGVHWSVVRVPS